MLELKIIFVREFIARVRTRAFLLSTFGVPVFIVLIALLPGLLGGGTTRKLAVVNEADATMGREFVAALRAQPKANQDVRQRNNTYLVEMVAGTAETLREPLNERVRNNELEGYVVIPATVLQQAAVEYHARSISSPLVMTELTSAASQAAQALRLQQSGISASQLRTLLQPIAVTGVRVTRAGEQQGSSTAAFILAYAVAMSIYMLTLIYGVSLLRSVLEEKTQRVAEVILSTVRPGYFLAGKVLGTVATALFQVSIWVVVVGVIAGPGGFAGRMGASTTVLQTLNVEPLVALSLAAFFVLGFLLYAAWFAAVGAAVSSEQEAQSLQTIAVMPLMVPMLCIPILSNDPLGRLATILGLFPLTAPVAMSMRLAAAPIPTYEVVLSLVLLLAGVIAMLWLAGRIFRVGMLSTGTKPSLQDLWRWVRSS